MSLADLWISSREQLEGKHVQQIMGFAGSGKLRDGNECSYEFRSFLSLIPSDALKRHAEECLTTKFDDSGTALQDVVNEVGRRLGFEVTNGRYRGVTNEIGYDGLWKSGPHTIVVESKTTDAYQIDLSVISGYRRALIKQGVIDEENSSSLLVVGRQSTDALEAQIRGSRQAWETRLISVDALTRLMLLKEDVEEPRVLEQVREVLIPHEFTKLDAIIDLVFSAREEVRREIEIEVAGDEEEAVPSQKKFTPVDFHAACIDRISAKLGIALVRRTRAIYGTPDSSVVVFCAVSREHPGKTNVFYWYAFHPAQRAALESARNAYVAFGCGAPDRVILVSFAQFSEWVPGLWITKLEDRFYWHVKLQRENESYLLLRSSGFDRIDVTSFLLAN